MFWFLNTLGNRDDQTKQSRGETSFDCFVKVRKIGFPFSFYSTRPFGTKTEKNEADIFEVTDVERRPRSNFLDHFHYSQAVTF